MIAILCLALPVGSSCAHYRHAVLSPHALIAQPAAERRLRLMGVARHVQHRTSHEGYAYDLVLVCDSQCVRVYYPNHSTIENGDRVSAVGTFYPVRKVGTSVYRNEMDADELLVEH
ncbi:MAG: hypothetical protein ABR584_00170 [Candidatus Baltobacteraceae bacterium]